MERLRIVLADDNPEILDIVTEMVEEEFSLVGLYKDGKSVLQHTAALKPDIIILDVSLGDSCGFDLARTLRSNGTTADILFLTIYEDEELIKAGFDAGGSAYVLKRRLRTDLLPALHAVANHEVFVSSTNH